MHVILVISLPTYVARTTESHLPGLKKTILKFSISIVNFYLVSELAVIGPLTCMFTCFCYQMRHFLAIDTNYFIINMNRNHCQFPTPCFTQHNVFHTSTQTTFAGWPAHHLHQLLTAAWVAVPNPLLVQMSGPLSTSSQTSSRTGDVPYQP